MVVWSWKTFKLIVFQYLAGDNLRIPFNVYEITTSATEGIFEY